MKILLGPLAKIGELFEQQNQKMSKALDVLSVDLVEVTKKNSEELSKQTVILQDIKALLMLQVRCLPLFLRLEKLVLDID